MTAPAAFPGGAELFRLGPHVAHLNHGSFGAVPVPVAAAHRRLAAEADADPDAFFLGVPDRLAGARSRIAAHLGTDPEGAALVDNATEAAHLALDALRLSADDEVLVTDHGYGTVVAAAARRARVTTVALAPDLPDEEAVRKAVIAALTPRTRVALLDQISSPTARFIATPGLLADLAARGVTTVVDGAHAPGMLARPLAGGPDFWFGNLHKWAYAPPGSALLAVSPAHRERVPAPVPSWEGDRGFPARWSTGPPSTTPAGSPPPRASICSRSSAPSAYAPTTAPWRATAPNSSPASRASPRCPPTTASPCGPCACRPASPAPGPRPPPCARRSRPASASGC